MFCEDKPILELLVQNHPFIDGNERTGTVTAVAFLDLNGYRVEIDNEKMFSFGMAVAEGQFSKSDLAGRAEAPPKQRQKDRFNMLVYKLHSKISPYPF